MMGKKTRALPAFVYILIQDFDGSVGWGRCPTLGMQDDLLLFSGPTAVNRPDLSIKWVSVPRERRFTGVCGQVEYDLLVKAGVLLIEMSDVPGVSSVIFLRPRVLGDSAEDQRWLAQAFPLASVPA